MTRQETSDGLGPKMPPGHSDVWSLVHRHAKGTARYLALSWKRSNPRSPAIEHAALEHAVALEMHCETATCAHPTKQPYYPLLPLQRELGTPKARYDVEAACQMIPQLLPYTDLELQELRETFAYRCVDFPDSRPSPERASALFAEWHNWLWDTTFSIPDSTEAAVGADRKDFGRSSELALASSRLATGLKVVLDLR